MAKVGDELFIESLRDELKLRVMNAAESAYCVIKFNKTFFTYYNYNYYENIDLNDLKCKISMKSALLVFKSPGQMDKQVEICEIKLDAQGLKIIFQLRCKHGIVKTHFVSIIEGKKMEGCFSTDTPNRLVAHHKVFSDALGNFQNAEDQVTIEVNPQTIHLRNYINDTVDLTKLTRTQLSLKPLEFEVFTIGVDTCITFSIKEFKAFLMFAEAVNLSTTLAFSTSGKPVFLLLSNDSTFEANFVLATIKPDNNTQYSDQSLPSTEASKRKRDDVSYENEDDSHLFNFIDEPNGKRDENDDLAESMCEERENSPSPIIFSQTNKIKKVFKRCFDITFDPSRKNPALIVLAEGSDSD